MLKFFPSLALCLLVVSSANGQQLNVEPRSLAFLYSIVTGIPPAQSIVVTSVGGGSHAFNVIVETQDGGGWIELSGTGVITPAVLNIAVKPLALAPGNYTGSVQLVSSAAAASPVFIPVTLSVIAGSRVIPQLADGGAWQTSLILVNTGPTPAAYSLRFWRESGLPLALPVEGRGETNGVEGTIPPAGSRTIETSGRAQAVLQGWGELAASPAVGALAVFRHQASGLPAMEAVSPVAMSGKRFLLAFDNQAGFVTSMALVNAGAQNFATAQVRMQDSNGVEIGTGSLDMPPRGHTAFRLIDRYPALANKRGVIEFSTPSDVITGLGLRFHPGGAFTSFPIFPDPGPAGVRLTNRILPHVADGGGWKTTVILQNTDVEAASMQMRFWQGNGTQLEIPFIGFAPGPSLMTTLGLGGLATLESSGAPASLSQGWAEIISPGSLEGFAVFRQQVAGRPDFEAAVPVTPALERFLVPFDNARGFVTSVALANPDSFRLARVIATLRDENGLEMGSEIFSLPARGHTAFALPDRFPVTGGKRGVAEFFSSTQALCALGLRFHPGGAFTSFPVMSR